MRRIVGGVFLSLDGVMQAPGGPTGAATPQPIANPREQDRQRRIAEGRW